jgi:long-subunit acyl-CoA synthetase (AMP-forming)
MILSTGSTLQSAHRKIFQMQFQIPIYDYYGLTETTGACILETEDLSRIQEKGIGRPFECIVKICGDGELAIYGENHMLRYLNDPEATAKRLRNGWLLTGDIVRINEHGCVILIGRKDRMMKDKNGELLNPEEIEKWIAKMEDVKDVYVTSYQDDTSVDRMIALIAFKNCEAADRILPWIRTALEEELPAAWIPNRMIAVAEIPRSPAGKISGEKVMQMITEYGSGGV